MSGGPPGAGTDPPPTEPSAAPSRCPSVLPRECGCLWGAFTPRSSGGVPGESAPGVGSERVLEEIEHHRVVGQVWRTLASVSALHVSLGFPALTPTPPRPLRAALVNGGERPTPHDEGLEHPGGLDSGTEHADVYGGPRRSLLKVPLGRAPQTPWRNKLLTVSLGSVERPSLGRLWGLLAEPRH